MRTPLLSKPPWNHLKNLGPYIQNNPHNIDHQAHMNCLIVKMASDSLSNMKVESSSYYRKDHIGSIREFLGSESILERKLNKAKLPQILKSMRYILPDISGIFEFHHLREKSRSSQLHIFHISLSYMSSHQGKPWAHKSKRSTRRERFSFWFFIYYQINIALCEILLPYISGRPVFKWVTPIGNNSVGSIFSIIKAFSIVMTQRKLVIWKHHLLKLLMVTIDHELFLWMPSRM